MAASTGLSTVLKEIVQVCREVESHLATESHLDSGEGAPGKNTFPIGLEGPRKQLANAAAQLSQLVTDPREYLEQLSANNQHLVCLRWIVNLGILQYIPQHGSIAYTDLANRASVPESQLKSVLRMTAAHGFLAEVTPLEISHSPTSALIATNPSFYDWARWLTNYSVPSAYHFADATQKWGRTEVKNETAFNIAMNVEVPFFGYLKENAKMNSMFSSYMRNVASSEATSFKHMISGFDWGGLTPGSKVIDVGGSGGHGSRALASAFPGLNFVVQDLPDTIENAKAALNTDESKLHADRVRFMSHDFFTPQPVVDGDIYFLRMIIHDWPDETAITILAHLRDALKKPGARIVIMDTILPQPGTVSLLQERQLRVRDLTMMQVFNAKEREYDTWKALVEKVGLRIIHVEQPEGSNMGLLELGLADATDLKAGGNARLVFNGNMKTPSVNLNINGASTINEFAHGSTPETFAVNGIHTTDKARPNGDTTHSGQASIPNGVSARISTRPMYARDVLPVLIIGAGISGLCLAQYLHKHAIPFVVFERDPSSEHRPQGYRLKLEADAAAALRESLTAEVYSAFEASCAESAIGETDFDPISGACIKSRAGGGLAGAQGLRASYTVDRTVFRRILMTGISDKIYFGREITRYDICEDNVQSYVVATFKDGATAEGRFLVGADGTRSAIRKQLVPEHKFLDTGATCIYGKTVMTPELLARYPARALRWMTVVADRAPLIQSILIGESPLTLLSEPIRFSRDEPTASLPEDYVYWVLIGRRELFTDATNTSASSTGHGVNSDKAYNTESAQASAAQSLALTEEWHPSLRSLFELQDVSQASTMRVVSAPPKLPVWPSNSCVTLLGDAVHAMSPCGGVGANVALRDAAELGKVFASTAASNEEDAIQSVGGKASDQHDMAQQIASFEGELRKRAFGGIMRSFVGSKAMFGQRTFEELDVAEL
ncbi:elsinochrome C biosynthesis cluster protein B elcB [Parastagonospora nodorum]|uniref:Elsinochrome C biosynthesis cluster protein B elcB n=1 Tax=Phaeosphaeria nodorum (strain SN15 / ATCC MYA-4574 / FGSC 10173) TaxID=321614 RepID=A0A7U2F2N4_PHANO|nr:elsinochrome C biosynthesis cluster protein B elcB [Parastagonospora nodorum]QRC97614.1 elsinochrome C biosynthesis cluster protein B elcB [Parastagonospora nodorum SN15]KAH3924588.1 elsinochrome C biosynthesis cluster protein B elcB [Parastagonospora nodorum]KAH3942006.1 elsinochrome C biosynthesis cluster protein B elcB [Parastagonospora nodorum]KAH3957428.1 elsinochrome C biosynthesis cluster protein B elcB [Parastagonospora nodorum]